MAYSIDNAASELMLEPEEMKEILEAFFEDAPTLLEQGKQALDDGDWQRLSRTMHALKGASLNMRMDALGASAARAEHAEQLPLSTLQGIIRDIERELHQTERVFHEYFASGA